MYCLYTIARISIKSLLTLYLRYSLVYLQYARIKCSAQQKYDKMTHFGRHLSHESLPKLCQMKNSLPIWQTFVFFYVIFRGLAR